MSQVQFRSDDTTQWGQGFGTGVDGNASINSGTDAPVNTTLTGTSGAFTGVVGAAAGFAVGNIVIIHQSQLTGVGTWQLNYIVGISGTTFSFLYPLVATFGSGCQIQKVPQYTNYTINGGQTFNGSSWNGSVGGIFAIFANGTVAITGGLSLVGRGFRGGNGAVATTAFTGEGLTGGLNTQTTAANGIGGGGGSSTNSANNGSGGGGGGHVSSGGSGVTGGTGSGGTAGGTGSDVADLTNGHFGGGGGGAANDTTTGGSGGVGGGFCLIIAPTITVTGSLNNNGANGNAGTENDYGGSGAGGDTLLKGQNITLGATLVTAGGGPTQLHGGNGGTGRIHIDYSSTLSGTTSPVYDSRKDQVYNPASFGSIL